MKIMGADFSGAKSPDIALAVGTLTDHILDIETIYPCDDRLDLYSRIAAASEATQCGLDFPFGLPQAALPTMNGQQLHDLVFRHTRSDFASLLTAQLGRYEGKCVAPSLVCRETDVACNAYSGVKRVNPSLVQMLYSGTKLLAYLANASVGVYPLTSAQLCQVCEIYPSHTWARVGLPRSTNVRGFVEKFNEKSIIQVNLPETFDYVATQDIADSLVACITTAAVQYRDNIYADWTKQPSFATDLEWAVAKYEGLIVRI